MRSTAIRHPVIVVGVDGSPTANAAIRWAIGEAALGNGSLMLVYAISPAIPTAGPTTLVAARGSTVAEATRPPDTG